MLNIWPGFGLCSKFWIWPILLLIILLCEIKILHIKCIHIETCWVVHDRNNASKPNLSYYSSHLLPFYPSCTAGNGTLLKILIHLWVLITDLIIIYLMNKNCFTLLWPKIKFFPYGGTASDKSTVSNLKFTNITMCGCHIWNRVKRLANT